MVTQIHLLRKEREKGKREREGREGARERGRKEGDGEHILEDYNFWWAGCLAK